MERDVLVADRVYGASPAAAVVDTVAGLPRDSHAECLATVVHHCTPGVASLQWPLATESDGEVAISSDGTGSRPALAVAIKREVEWMSEDGSGLVREGMRGAAARTKSDTMGAREDTSPVRGSGGSLVQRDRRTIARTSLTARDRTNYSVHMDVAVPISRLEGRLDRLGVDGNKTHRD